jgi:hypothetical protein
MSTVQSKTVFFLASMPQRFFASEEEAIKHERYQAACSEVASVVDGYNVDPLPYACIEVIVDMLAKRWGVVI